MTAHISWTCCRSIVHVSSLVSLNAACQQEVGQTIPDVCGSHMFVLAVPSFILAPAVQTGSKQEVDLWVPGPFFSFLLMKDWYFFVIVLWNAQTFGRFPALRSRVNNYSAVLLLRILVLCCWPSFRACSVRVRISVDITWMVQILFCFQLLMNERQWFCPSNHLQHPSRCIATPWEPPTAP